jgi:hypothetical protein
MMRHHGYYTGKVVDNKDPLKTGRVRIYVPGLSDQSTELNPDGLPWAYQKTPTFLGGGANSGMFSVPRVGTIVTLYFDNGSLSHPIYDGSRSCIENDVPDWHSLAREISEDLVKLGKESDSEYAAKYPDNSVVGFGGCSVEYDGTPGEERIQFTHKNKSYIKMSKSGVHLKSTGKRKDTTAGNLHEYVGGSSESTVVGDVVENAASKHITAPIQVITGNVWVVGSLTVLGPIITPATVSALDIITSVHGSVNSHTHLNSGGPGVGGPPVPTGAPIVPVPPPPTPEVPS